MTEKAANVMTTSTQKCLFSSKEKCEDSLEMTGVQRLLCYKRFGTILASGPLKQHLTMRPHLEGNLLTSSGVFKLPCFI